MSITGDGEGNVWVGTDRGLSRIAPGRFGRITNFTAREGLPQETVFDVYVDARGVAWIGTYGGGLVRMEKDKLTVYDKKVGLFDDVVYRVLEDGAGRLWMSSNRGVFSVARQELEDFAAGKARSIGSVSFGLSDGMRSVECNGWYQPAGWRARDGRLWFPTVHGLAVIDPARLRRNEVVPPVLLERLLVDAAEVPLRDGFELPPGRKRLEFHYTALSLLEPARVAFRYRLEPFDEGWVDAGGRRVAYYTNLPPGPYRFQVAAANNDGVWNEQGAGLAFAQKPRFTQTSWFYVLCAAGAVLFGFFLHRIAGGGPARAARAPGARGAQAHAAPGAEAGRAGDAQPRAGGRQHAARAPGGGGRPHRALQPPLPERHAGEGVGARLARQGAGGAGADRHRPLQEAQRRLRPSHRRRAAAPGGGGAEEIDPPARRRGRALRRRGVRVAPARHHAGRRRACWPTACGARWRRWACPTASRPTGT